MKSAHIHPVAKPMAEFCSRLHQTTGWIPGLSGQASAWDEDILWITPPDISFRDLQPQHLIAVCPDGRILGKETPLLTSQLNWHRAFYKTVPDMKAILVAKPPTLCTLAQREIGNDPQANSLKFSNTSQPILILPPQSDSGRAQAVTLATQQSPLIIEVGFGVMVAGRTLTDILNRLEQLEVDALLSLS